MTINFDGFEAPEGFPVDALKTPELTTFIDSYVSKQKETATTLVKEDLQKATTAKAMADEKLDKALEDLKAAKANPGNDNEKIAELERKVKSAKDDAKVEYGAQINSLTEQLEKNKDVIGGLEGQLQKTELTSYLRDGIAEYNAANKGVTVKQGAEDYLIEAGLSAYKKTESGDYRAYEGDQALTGNDGFMNRAEFITHLRKEPKYQIFFEQPSGGGAAGGDNKGGAIQPGAMGGSKEQRTASLANRFPDLPRAG